MFNLTAENYYSPEADQEYYSCSQYDDFMSCEAMAKAKLDGLFIPKDNEAFLVGNYFHTKLEGIEPFEQFKQDHIADIHTSKKALKKDLEAGTYDFEDADGVGRVITGLKAPYVTAERMFGTIMQDPALKQLYDMAGANEVIMTGKLFGGEYPFKIRLDKYITDPIRSIIDWKTARDIYATQWMAEMQSKMSFVWAYGYVRRAGVYLEIEKQFTGEDQPAVFDLAVITKQDPCDKELINMNSQQYLDMALDEMAENMGKIAEVKEGRRKPLRCGKCDYCRATKRITRRKSFIELDADVYVERVS